MSLTHSILLKKRDALHWVDRTVFVCIFSPSPVASRDLITIGCIWSTLAHPGLSMEEADKSREDPSCQASKDKESQVERGPWCEVRTFSSQDLQACEWKRQACVCVCAGGIKLVHAYACE